MSEVKQPAKDLKAFRVLVTATSYGRDDPQLKADLEAAVGEVIYNPNNRPLTSSEMCVLIPEIDGCIAGLDMINAEVIRAARRLRVIARYGVGIDRVDIQAATARGIAVTNTPGANAAAVAELAIGLILCLAREIPRSGEATRRGEWPRASGVGLKGKTAGLIGFGAIGREAAIRLQAFGCRVLVFDPYVTPETILTYGAEGSTLDDLLARSDFVSLHTAATDETMKLVDSVFLAKMKSRSFLINTARGELIDEAALLQALELGHLRGAALDCFSTEPPLPDTPLLKLPQVIVTPHIGAHTDEATARMGWMALESCLAVLRGERPNYLVNPEALGELK